ncbi:hypothetical protein N7510_009460 [Penicillium lagena]|uniref:uncharacterized protein n=1 Tax=Penicillium lagena TaxID=94218 RepID=UPI00254046E6|nr:uncharacterized protein N7510_009460 [Penicillium lagena]KAJ5606679.1 hypothetical protein N7510_009460 [Penicillium lagena]
MNRGASVVGEIKGESLPALHFRPSTRPGHCATKTVTRPVLWHMIKIRGSVGCRTETDAAVGVDDPENR